MAGFDQHAELRADLVARHSGGVGDGGPDEGDVEQPVDLQVVVVLGHPGQDPRVLLAEHRVPENRPRHGHVRAQLQRSDARRRGSPGRHRCRAGG